MPGSFANDRNRHQADPRRTFASLLLSRELGFQYKTAWVLLMKLREVVASRHDDMSLGGEVEIDGRYAGGHARIISEEGSTEERSSESLQEA
jgi:hypothetical protein